MSLFPILISLISNGSLPSQAVIDGISFADDPTIYAPVRDLCTALGMQVGFDGETATINGVVPEGTRSLICGSRIVPIRSLKALGVTLSWNEETDSADLSLASSSASVRRGEKRVVIDKSRQVLDAFQGDRLVLSTPVSTGRRGHTTPNGQFTAGPAKHRMHYSRLYDWSPMPWSVQVDGDIFIHGYASVPRVPASHGCIRMRTDGPNPAQWFFEWVDVGVPITIQGDWQG